MPPTVTSDIELIRLKRVRFLQAAYDLSAQGALSIISLQQAERMAELSDHEGLSIANYLHDKGLFYLDGGGWSGHITVGGIDMVEGWRKPVPSPEKPVKTETHFSNTVNNFGTISGSNILQSGSDSLFLNQQESLSARELIGKLEGEIRNAMFAARLNQSSQEDLVSSVGAIKYEVSTPRPKKAVLLAHLESIVSIFKLAAVAPEVISAVVATIDKFREHFLR